MPDTNPTPPSKSDNISFSDLLEKKFSYGATGDSTRALVDDDEYKDQEADTEKETHGLNSQNLARLEKEERTETPSKEINPTAETKIEAASTNPIMNNDKNMVIIPAEVQGVDY